MFRAAKEGGFQIKRIISKVHGPRQAWWVSSQAVDWGLGPGTREVPTLCARNGSVSWGRTFIEATSNHSPSWGHWKHSCTCFSSSACVIPTGETEFLLWL